MFRIHKREEYSIKDKEKIRKKWAFWFLFRWLFGGGSLPLSVIKVRLFCRIRVTFFRCAAKITAAQNKRRTCYSATPSSKMYILVHF